MKAISNIITAVLLLQANFLFASNFEKSTVPDFETDYIFALNLAPVTPMEADFCDLFPEPVMNTINLAPVAPATADFEDNALVIVPNNDNLAPETPSFADFEEISFEQPGTVSLLPVTPAEADFE